MINSAEVLNPAWADAGYILIRVDCESLLPSLKHSFKFKPGPNKTYFGSKTDNKVNWQGKQLIPSAPPMLKSILTTLGLIAWATNHNSQLSLHNKTVFSCFTDLDP